MKRFLILLGRASLSTLMLYGVTLAAAASGQTMFSSGSTGADGPLSFDPPLPGDPPIEQVIDMSAKPEGVWNYTTINIPAGVNVSFTKNAANSGVIWLATGDVKIAGEINLDGANGTLNVARGNEAPGGAGGFAGGRGGGRSDVSGSQAGTPGEGPGGGAPGMSCNAYGSNGSYGSAGPAGLAGPTLLGGSGGGGSGSCAHSDGSNGGGGGGAIVIASSGGIRIDGTVHANGGTGASVCNDFFCIYEGTGSGGAIRLVANRIEGSGTISATASSPIGGSPGVIRTEAFVFALTNLTNPIAQQDAPHSLNFASPGSIRITSIAGWAVPVPPGGNTASPDVIFSQAGPITVSLTTTNIPQGTRLTVRVVTVGQVISVLSNLVDSAGNASATLTVPAGFGTIQAFAEYTVMP